jgi:hypothetical protein
MEIDIFETCFTYISCLMMSFDSCHVVFALTHSVQGFCLHRGVRATVLHGERLFPLHSFVLRFFKLRLTMRVASALFLMLAALASAFVPQTPKAFVGSSRPPATSLDAAPTMFIYWTIKVRNVTHSLKSQLLYAFVKLNTFFPWCSDGRWCRRVRTGIDRWAQRNRRLEWFAD